jgi:hypothetical protein
MFKWIGPSPLVSFDLLQNVEREFQELAGVSLDEFHKLLPIFTEVYEKLPPNGRINDDDPLDRFEDKLLFALACRKSNPEQTNRISEFGLDFGLEHTKAKEYVKKLKPILNRVMKQQEPSNDP